MIPKTLTSEDMQQPNNELAENDDGSKCNICNQQLSNSHCGCIPRHPNCYKVSPDEQMDWESECSICGWRLSAYRCACEPRHPGCYLVSSAEEAAWEAHKGCDVCNLPSPKGRCACDPPHPECYHFPAKRAAMDERGHVNDASQHQ